MSKIKKNRNRSYDFDHYLPKTFNLLPYTHYKAVQILISVKIPLTALLWLLRA